MASPLFEIEDDEDFFDKLIADEDEVEFTKSGTGAVVATNASVVPQAFGDLKISEVSQAKVDSTGSNVDVEATDNGTKGLVGGAGVSLVDLVEDDMRLRDDEVFRQESVVRSTDANLRSESVDDNTVGESTELDKKREGENVNVLTVASASRGMGIKEVDWSVFSSESREQNHIGHGSYSDFFSGLEDNGGDPFANVGSGSSEANLSSIEGIGEKKAPGSSLAHHQGVDSYQLSTNQNPTGKNLVSDQDWENMYPGWRFDPTTQQWHQLDKYEAKMNTSSNTTTVGVSDGNLFNDTQHGDGQVSNFGRSQESLQSASGILEDANSSSSAFDLSHLSHQDVEYPESMYFDSQYPEWYYDRVTGEWHTLESYNESIKQSVVLDQNHYDQHQHVSTGGDFSIANSVSSVESQPVHHYGYVSHNHNSSDQALDLTDAAKPYKGQSAQIWQPETTATKGADSFTRQTQNFHAYGSDSHFENVAHQFVVQNSERHFTNMSHEPVVHANKAMWPSDGRPSHPLVTFGFGGKLFVMKSNGNLGTSDPHGTQNSAGCMIDVLSLTDVVLDKAETQSTVMDTSGYFSALCRQSFPGPVVGGSVGSKDLNKWIDERIMNYENTYDKDSKAMKILFALLKVACQHYGKLRSPLGSDFSLQERDSPESAVANLFASSRINSPAITHLILNWPSEGQAQATAHEMETLLVSGRKKEALECAKQGQLWGPALVLAAQLGDQFFSETVKEMTLKQLAVGSPLRTLYLLIAGSPGDAFSNTSTNMLLTGVPTRVQPYVPVQFGSNPMLDDWEDNLSILIANRTKDDEYAIIHLGDSLWKERSEVIAAHVCYLVAETNVDAYSDTARVCLIGADHLRHPRTFAHPEAIQRTELYEYSQVLGNSQFLLLPFQPYKILYAYMLAEIGKLSESLKYCQALSKTLKTGRAQEDNIYQQLISSLEDRIRTYQQGGYGNNLAPTKLVGKLLNVWSNTRGVVGPPPPVTSLSNNTFEVKAPATQFDHVPHFNSGYVPQFSSGLPPLAPSPSHVFQHKDTTPQFNTFQHKDVAPQFSTFQQKDVAPQFSTFQHKDVAPQFSTFQHKDVAPQYSNFQHKDVAPQYSNFQHKDVAPQYSNFQHKDVAPQYSNFQHKDVDPQFSMYGVSTHQSTVAMSPLIPSASAELLSELPDGTNKSLITNRSISEPDLGKSPKKGDLHKEEVKPQEAHPKAAVPAGPSRFGRFGSQIFQKTVGLVLRPRSDKQAKLGEKNKFYYDEKLKRWVEEGAEPPVEEAAIPPPPMTGTFQNRIPDHDGQHLANENLQVSNGPSETSLAPNSGTIPPIPSGSGQFSGRGVRSRYVDTFNKTAGSSSKIFKPPSIAAAKPGGSLNPKFFIPPATIPVDETLPKTTDDELDPSVQNESPSTASREDGTVPKTPESEQEISSAYETPSTSSNGSSFSSPPITLPSPSPVSMQRFSSMDNISQRRQSVGVSVNPAKPDARRTLSWNGSIPSSPSDDTNTSNRAPIQPYGAALNMSPSPMTPPTAPLTRYHSMKQSNSSSEDLQEVDF